MAKNIEKPEWYREEFYNWKRTPEEWLYEIWKRDKFNRDDLNLPFSTRILNLEERKKFFLEVIFLNKIEEFLSGLQATPSQPIKHLAVSDVFRMASLISSSDWYKNHPDRALFESSIAATTKGERLSKEQKIAFNKFYDMPWHSFHENSSDKTWYPNKDMPYLSGIPISLDPSYAKQDITEQLNLYLHRWVGKLQDIELQFDAWQERKILAVFDLIMWFRIQNMKYTKISLHRLIWTKGRFSVTKNEYVNPDEDIDYSINLIERVINQNATRTLAIMCEARKLKKQIETA